MGLYMVSYEEIALKGNNKRFFESVLRKNLSKAFTGSGRFRIIKNYGRLYVYSEADKDEVLQRFQRVFGIKSIAIVKRCDLDIEKIKKAAQEVLEEVEDTGKTFKVKTKRVNKSFEYRSMEIDRIVGEHILNTFPNLKVDVHNHHTLIKIEIREKAYAYAEKIVGPGGLPVGTSGKAVLLISGGIDSPVAGYLTMKRGAPIDAVYFHTFPYTTDRAKEKVIKLSKVLSQYNSEMNLYVINFTDVVKELADKTPNSYLTIMMRRMMVRIAEKLAKNIGAQVLVTGESLGQVASQTMEAIVSVNQAASMPILRPLVSFDKTEIMKIARNIGTYDISIEPYADCCTVFVPLSPVTKPRLEKVLEYENSLDIEKLVEDGMKNVERWEAMGKNGKRWEKM